MMIAHRARNKPLRVISPSSAETIRRFTVAQTVNIRRSAVALRPFHTREFGTGAASPSPAQVEAVNKLILRLRHPLLRQAQDIDHAIEISINTVQSDDLREVLQQKTKAIRSIKSIEKVWDFYLEIFSQRLTKFAPMLLASDRIARDCYQVFYSGMSKPVSIPSPPPLTYMETGFAPATYRRGIQLTKLGRQINPFPLIQLPYHRLINPWTLGAIHHETGHNLQSDRKMWKIVPRRIFTRLRKKRVSKSVAQVWSRWHKEIWADLAAVLLGGPGIVSSLIDVIARSPAVTMHFNPNAVHPIPYVRGLINFHLLRRLGFKRETQSFEQLWQILYPQVRGIPKSMLNSLPIGIETIIDVVCYEPYAQLGNKALIDVINFRPEHQQQVVEAAHRLARGNDPGIIPVRFLVGAMRVALDKRLAPPHRIANSFYEALNQR